MWRLKFCNLNHLTNGIEGATRLSMSIVPTKDKYLTRHNNIN